MKEFKKCRLRWVGGKTLVSADDESCCELRKRVDSLIDVHISLIGERNSLIEGQVSLIVHQAVPGIVILDFFKFPSKYGQYSYTKRA